jgi:hypothetical protein
MKLLATPSASFGITLVAVSSLFLAGLARGDDGPSQKSRWSAAPHNTLASQQQQPPAQAPGAQVPESPFPPAFPDEPDPTMPQDQDLGNLLGTTPVVPTLFSQDSASQVISFDPETAGWNQAGNVDGQVSDQLRGHWVALDTKGALHGTLVGFQAPVAAFPGALPGVAKVYVLRGGLLAGTGTVGPDGEFLVEGLSTGVYTLVAYSPTALAAYGLTLIEPEGNNTSLPTHVEITPVAKQSRALNELVKYYSPSVRFLTYADYQVGEGAADPARWYGLRGIADQRPQVLPGSTIAPHQVTISADGTTRGRVHRIHSDSGRPLPVRNTTIILWQNERIVTSTKTDNFGVFELRNLAPGSYGLVAVGGDGIAVLMFDAVGGPGSQASLRTRDQFQPAGFRPESYDWMFEGTPLDVALIDPEAIGWINHFITEQSYKEAISSPIAPPYPPMGGCGCCDGGWGGGLNPQGYGTALPQQDQYHAAGYGYGNNGYGYGYDGSGYGHGSDCGCAHGHGYGHGGYGYGHGYEYGPAYGPAPGWHGNSGCCSGNSGAVDPHSDVHGPTPTPAQHPQ